LGPRHQWLGDHEVSGRRIHPGGLSEILLAAVGRIPVPHDIAPQAADFAKDEIIFAIDPPEHTLARLTLQYGFTKKIIDGLADHANAVAEQVIDRIIDRGNATSSTTSVTRSRWVSS